MDPHAPVGRPEIDPRDAAPQRHLRRKGRPSSGSDPVRSSPPEVIPSSGSTRSRSSPSGAPGSGSPDAAKSAPLATKRSSPAARVSGKRWRPVSAVRVPASTSRRVPSSKRRARTGPTASPSSDRGCSVVKRIPRVRVSPEGAAASSRRHPASRRAATAATADMLEIAFIAYLYRLGFVLLFR